MLTRSEIKFFNSCNKLAIEFQIKYLDIDVLESIVDEEKVPYFKFDSDKLYLVERSNKYLIALIYNVDLIDSRVGWLLKKMCITSNDLGFIISPMSRWHRHRVIEFYKAIKGSMYTAYFDFTKLEDGLIYLVVEYNLK